MAKVIHVDDNASAGGDGSSWSTAHKYLQDALAVADSGDEIWVAEGTYKPDQGEGKTAGDRASPFVLVNGVGMYGGFLGTESSRDPQGDNNQTILSGEIDENSPLWSLNVVSGANLNANTTLDGFRITKGNANGAGGTIYANGGGLWIKDSEFKISNCVFTNNSATYGGGIYASSSSLTLTNCVFTNNSATHGGGISSSSSSLTLTNCVFTNNSANDDGGGISSNSSSSLTLTNCVFTNNSANNSAYSDGGGIYSSSYSSSSWTLTNCVFTNNSANDDGGGISSNSSLTSLTLTNCVFTNNSANDDGGGISSSSSLTLTNCVFTNNSANDDGGGIYSYSLTLTNCILWKNTSDSVEGHGLKVVRPELFESFVLQEAIEAEYPGDPNARDVVYEPNLNILHGWSEDARAFDADPQFVNIDNPVGPDGIWFTEDDGLRLREGSPAIDAGYNDALGDDAGDLDEDGNLTEPIPFDSLRSNRIIGSSVDIGPYEFDPDNPPPVVKNLLTLSTTTGGTVTGGGYYEKEVTATIEAVPSSGYLFSNWSGDANGSTNPLSITMDSDKTITANFTQDLNDDDEDGLSNFDELITYGTNSNDPDSDDDGLLDGLEVEYDTNPLSSDIKVLNLVRDNPSVISTDNSSGYQDLLLGRDTNATPYTPSWFYIPDQGWMWSQKGVYPYFFDANSSNWMYFQSGHENPRFYHYGTKKWMTLD